MLVKVSKINPLEKSEDTKDAKNSKKAKPDKKPAAEPSESSDTDSVESLFFGSYEGERNEQGERHGYGNAVLLTRTGERDYYQGYYQFNKRHGLGTYVFSNGARYVGDYRENKKHGHGIFIYPDGSKYTGEWVNDLREGYGTYKYPNGDIYDGEWKNHQRHGQGRYTYSDTKCYYEGEWVNGKLQGKCQFVTQSYTFSGNFRKNLPIKDGSFAFSNSTKAVKHGNYFSLPVESSDESTDPILINKWIES